MFISKYSISAIMATLVLLNTACSSDSKTAETPGSDDGAQTENTNDFAENGDNSNTGDQGNNQSSTAGLFGPPQFNIADCGSVEISAAQAPNDVNTPATILTEQLVQGQLAEDSGVLSFDVWQVELQPGNYHLILDSWLASREFGYHGVRVTSLGETSDDDERLVRSAASGFSERAYEYLEILNPTTLRLKVEPSYNATMNYVMGVFPNGVSVPSPRFTDCPATTRASLDTTSSVTLSDLNSAEDYRWFQMNLNAGVYTLDASVQSSDRYTGYRVELMQRFGEDTSDRVASVSNPATSVNSSDEFTVLDDGEVWFRVENAYSSDGNFEITVSQ